MSVLVLGELDGGAVAKATLCAVTAATELGGDIHLLLVGSDIDVSSGSTIHGVQKVLVADSAKLAHPSAEDVATLLVALMPAYDQLVAGATSFSKNVLPRAAALLDIAQVSDVVQVLGPDRYKRYIYAGNALATVVSTDAKHVLTVRATAFAPAEAASGSCTIETIDVPASADLSTFIDQEVSGSERPELTSARIVVSGGRGLGSGENFKLLDELADALGAAVGASRAAVDAGFVPNDYQVGQTGKIVAPDLYLAVGISGAIQHLAGMKDSKVIVAINKDEEAPMFQVADYGMVGDLFKLVPELTEEVKRRKTS